MVDDEFRIFIDTIGDKSIYCHQLTYGVHEAKIMVDHISNLEVHDRIRDGKESYGTLLLLAAKPYQKSCVDIHKFVWILTLFTVFLTA